MSGDIAKRVARENIRANRSTAQKADRDLVGLIDTARIAGVEWYEIGYDLNEHAASKNSASSSAYALHERFKKRFAVKAES